VRSNRATAFGARQWGSSLTCDPGPLPLRLALVAALGEWLLVLVIGLCWVFLLARLVQGHIEGAWRYLAWTVVGLLAVLLLRYAVNLLGGQGW